MAGKPKPKNSNEKVKDTGNVYKNRYFYRHSAVGAFVDYGQQTGEHHQHISILNGISQQTT